MPNLPKVVRDRLAGAPVAASSHPDPDLLTAFVEGGISGRERDGVLTHLAGCAACREVVSLAAPEVVVDRGQVAASRGGRKFWSVPMLRWAAVSATVVLVLAAGLMFRPSATHHDYAVVSDKAGVAPEARGDMASSAISAREPSDKKQVLDSAVSSYDEAKPRKTLTTKQSPAGDRDRLEANQEMKVNARLIAPAAPPANSMALADNTASMARSVPAARAKSGAPSPPVPAAASQAASGGPVTRAAGTAAGVASSVEVANTNPGSLDVESAPVQTNTEAVEMQSTQRKAGKARQKKDELALAKEAGTNLPEPAEAGKSAQAVGETGAGVAPGRAGGIGGVAGGGRPAVELMATPTSIPQAKLPPVRWTIDASGNLQRSNDLGKTWQVVPVAEGEHLQALAVVQSNVWAGGTAGALYHSSDGGGHWTRVRPTAGNLSLKDDVTRISLPDAQHVSVTTTSSEVWSSADGGQTWRKNSH